MGLPIRFSPSSKQRRSGNHCTAWPAPLIGQEPILQFSRVSIMNVRFSTRRVMSMSRDVGCKQLIKARLHATDGDMGSVRDLLFHHAIWIVRHLVVNTGGWWPGRRVLVSPKQVLAIRLRARDDILGAVETADSKRSGSLFRSPGIAAGRGNRWWRSRREAITSDAPKPTATSGHVLNRLQSACV
jgi:hypothetical protein